MSLSALFCEGGGVRESHPGGITGEAGGELRGELGIELRGELREELSSKYIVVVKTAAADLRSGKDCVNLKP
jgi:hypothetical protein